MSAPDRGRRERPQPPRRRAVAPRDAGDSPGADGDVPPPEPALPPELRLRRATLDDLPVVLELRFALLREHADNPLYGRLRRDAHDRAERLYAAQLVAENELTLLAEWRGSVVGILRCMIGQGSPLMHPERYGYIASVFVRPPYRRRGVLRALLAAAEAWSAEQGLTELRLHNAVDSVLANTSWEALGFQPVEVLRIRPLRPPG